MQLHLSTVWLSAKCNCSLKIPYSKFWIFVLRQCHSACNHCRYINGAYVWRITHNVSCKKKSFSTKNSLQNRQKRRIGVLICDVKVTNSYLQLPNCTVKNQIVKTCRLLAENKPRQIQIILWFWYAYNMQHILVIS